MKISLYGICSNAEKCNSCGIVQFKSWNLDERVVALITPTCFNIFRNMTSFNINNRFLIAAIKQLDNGAFNFHGNFLYWGLEDIFNITGLPVDGLLIVCGDFDLKKILEELLGYDDSERNEGSYYVKKNWLLMRFVTVEEAHMNDEESRKIWLPRYARAYFSFLMGTLLFPKNHKPTVFIGYLLFFRDLNPAIVDIFSWGSAVLAKLQDAFSQKTIAVGAMWIVEVCDW